MKIEYRAPGGLGYTTLADEANLTAMEEFKPSGAIQKQNVPLCVAPGSPTSSFKQPYGNVTVTLNLKLTNTYMTAGVGDWGLALQQSRIITLALLTTKNHIKVTQSAIGGSTLEVQWFPNAICTRCETSVEGCAVVFSLQFEADLVTTTEPA